MSLIIYVPIELNRFIDVDFFCAMRRNAFDEWWRRGFLLEQGWVMQKYAMGWMEALDWRESYFRRNIFTDCVKQKVKQNITTKMRWFRELKKRATVKALETFTWFCQGKVKKNWMTKNFLLTLVFVFWLWPMFTMLELRLQTKCAHEITHGRLYVAPSAHFT